MQNDPTNLELMKAMVVGFDNVESRLSSLEGEMDEARLDREKKHRETTERIDRLTGRVNFIDTHLEVDSR